MLAPGRGLGKNARLFCRSCDRILVQSGARQAHNSLPPGRDIGGPQARLGHTASKTIKEHRNGAKVF